MDTKTKEERFKELEAMPFRTMTEAQYLEFLKLRQELNK